MRIEIGDHAPALTGNEFYVTCNGRFVHRGVSRTSRPILACGGEGPYVTRPGGRAPIGVVAAIDPAQSKPHPRYPHVVIELNVEQARRMHACGKCWPK